MNIENMPVVLSDDGRTLLMVNDSEVVRFVVPEGVERIEEHAFSFCTGVKEVVLSETVREIAEYAFSDCKSLESVLLPASLEVIGKDCFSGCSHLRMIEVAGDSQRFKSFDGVLYDQAMTVVLKYPSGKEIVLFEIPEGVTRVDFGAFESNLFLESVSLPKSVTLIDHHAFYTCKALSTVSFDEGLVEISDFAFMGCSSLERLSLPGTIKTIGAYAFSGCSVLSEVVLPNGLASLMTNAFCHCEGLRSVRIPSTVTSMEDGVFNNCPELVDIYCEVRDPDGMEVLSLDVEDELWSRCTLHVPAGSVQLYRGHELWGRFGRIEPLGE